MENNTDPIKLEFEVIMSELKAGKADTGRPRNLSLETYKNFLYYFLHTGLREWSAAKSGIGVSSYKRVLAESETFRSVLDRDQEDLKATALMNISKSIRGIPPTYDEKGKEITPGVPGDVADSKWALQTIFKPKEDDGGSAPNLKAPENEEQANLMLKLLNKHHDYVESKRNKSTEPTE